VASSRNFLSFSYHFLAKFLSKFVSKIMSAFRVQAAALEFQPGSLKSGAALEVLGYLAIAAAATLGFLLGWLSCNQAAVVTSALLLSLLGLAWHRFDGGRHPCFFFLCMLTLFQGGRLIAYCAGAGTEIFRITLMTSEPFDLPPAVAGLTLLSIALSAICIYAPCRWHYRSGSALRGEGYERFLPYLYLLFCLSVPVQLYKNFCYYQYAKDHGGYLVVFIDHGGMAASIPVVVRAISLISLPAFVGIFVLEGRKRFLRTVTAVYFAIAGPILLMGSRGGIFSLVLALWYVAKVKSGQRARLYTAGLLGGALVLAGSLIGSFRAADAGSSAFDGPSQFVAGQGSSLNITEVAIAYRRQFAPQIFSNLADELRSAFFPTDHMAYVAGKNFDADVSMFLNPTAYQLGSGSGSSYLAESYLAGGLGGVVLASALLGALFHGMNVYARNPVALFLIAMILPDMLLMPRGGLLDWVSASLRVALSVLLLLAGWYCYRTASRIGGILLEPDGERVPKLSPPKFAAPRPAIEKLSGEFS
jgi:oligosaccharide repeat unit polymerase